VFPRRAGASWRAFSVVEPTVRAFGWTRNHPGWITTIQAAISV
jgi:hypothetical protein